MRKGPQIVDLSLLKPSFPLSSWSMILVRALLKAEPWLTTCHYWLTVRLNSAAFSLLSQARRNIIRNDIAYPPQKAMYMEISGGNSQAFQRCPEARKQLREQSSQFRRLGQGGANYRIDRPVKPNRKPLNHGNGSYGKKWKNKSTKHVKARKNKHTGEQNEVCQHSVSDAQTSDKSDTQDHLFSSDRSLHAITYDLNNTSNNFAGVSYLTISLNGKLKHQIDGFWALLGNMR